jgi:signal transduction histidine kinase
VSFRGFRGLAAQLGAGSVAIVLIAVIVVAASSIRLLGRLGDQQALARVQLAGASAREYLRRINEDALSNARILAERPALLRILTQGQSRELEPILRRFCETSGMDGCAAFEDDQLIASGGANVLWDEVQAAHLEQGERFLLAPRAGGAIVTGASARVGRSRDINVIAVRLINQRMIGEMREQVAAQVNVTNFATYAAPQDDPFTELHTAALSSGRTEVRRVKALDAYAATVLLAASTGEMIGLIDTRLDADEFDSSVRALGWRIALIAIAVVAIAGVGGVFYGRWLVRPLTALRGAADRIGRGDFSAAMPTAGQNEVGALAGTMDEMRRNLVELTATLRRSEAEARAVLAGVVEGVYSVDAERRIRYANPQVARMLGKKSEEIIGRFCGDVLNPEPRDGMRPCDIECPILAARMAVQGRAAERLCRTDGTVRSAVIVSASPVDGLQVQVLRDETDLEAVRRARDSVLANISHEFRTPLAAQLASIELLQDGVDRMTHAEQRDLFQHLHRGVLRLMRLVDNLLESVRIEAGQLAIRHQSLRMSEVIEEAMELVRPLLGQRRQSIANELAADFPRVRGDAQRLVQVLVNLLANASKFAPEDSVVRIGGLDRGERVSVWVEDEGPGVADHDRTAVFRRFQRSTTEEPEAPGLGLGLWIVRSIIERHGGSVDVRRTDEQRTRFTFTLERDGEI